MVSTLATGLIQHIFEGEMERQRIYLFMRKDVVQCLCSHAAGSLHAVYIRHCLRCCDPIVGLKCFNMLDPLSGNNHIVWKREAGGLRPHPPAFINAHRHSHIWAIDPIVTEAPSHECKSSPRPPSVPFLCSGHFSMYMTRLSYRTSGR